MWLLPRSLPASLGLTVSSGSRFPSFALSGAWVRWEGQSLEGSRLRLQALMGPHPALPLSGALGNGRTIYTVIPQFEPFHKPFHIKLLYVCLAGGRFAAIMQPFSFTLSRTPT